MEIPLCQLWTETRQEVKTTHVVCGQTVDPGHGAPPPPQEAWRGQGVRGSRGLKGDGRVARGWGQGQSLRPDDGQSSVSSSQSPPRTHDIAIGTAGRKHGVKYFSFYM